MTTKSDQVVTPPTAGPAADPALLGNAGATADAQEVGFNMAVNTMQKFGRELETLPAEGRRLVEQALSSVSTTNHRSTSGATSTNSKRGSSIDHEKDEQLSAFVGLVNTLVDTSPARIPLIPLVETLILSSIVLFAFSVSFYIGTYLLAPFITMLIPPVGAAILSLFAVPTAVYMALTNRFTPLEKLWLVVKTGLAQGLLSGAALANLSIFAEPFISLTCLSSAFALVMVKQAETRTGLLALITATSLTVHTVLGAIEGALSPSYMSLSVLYTIAALIPIQLAARDKKKADGNIYTAIIVGFSVASKLAIYGMIGVGPLIMEEVAVKGASGEGMMVEQAV